MMKGLKNGGKNEGLVYLFFGTWIIMLVMIRLSDLFDLLILLLSACFGIAILWLGILIESNEFSKCQRVTIIFKC